MKKAIYLDYAAATPLDPAVFKAMQPYLTETFYNPSATYLAGRQARRQLDEIRSQTAGVLGVRPTEIVFTAGATEANNLAIQGIMRQYPEGEVLTSAIEHESVLEPARLFPTKEVPVDKTGRVKLDRLSGLINDKTVLLSVMLVNNELGVIQPLREISAIVAATLKDRLKKGNKPPLYLHTDAAQAGNYLDLNPSRLGVDLMSLNGGKIYGPKQAGALFVKAGVWLKPLILGGGQEFGWRSGTENLSAAAGLAEALKVAKDRRGAEARRVMGLRDYFEAQLVKLVAGAQINGSSKHRAPHLVSLTIAGQDNERLMMQLDEAGIQCAVGSACSASKDEASHVLLAIGLTSQAARSTLRFSLGRMTTKTELAKTVQELAKLTASNR